MSLRLLRAMNTLQERERANYKERDYSYLEGRVIKLDFGDGFDDDVIDIIIAGIDYYIGMTLKIYNKGLPEGKRVGKHVMCYNGANSPTPDAGTRLGRYDYDKWFKYAVKALEEGWYDVNEGYRVSGDAEINTQGAGGATCGFGG